MAANAIRERSGSMIDVDRMPADFIAAITYLPTAGLNGLFAPYPNSWASKNSLFWIVGVVETFTWYLLFPGMLWLVWKSRKNPVLWWVILSTFAVLTVEAYLSSNLGTLHRIRYPFLFIFVLFGCIGWCALMALFDPKILFKNGFSFLDFFGLLRRDINQKIESIYKVTPLILVNGLLFFSLFIRDILYAHVFGFSTVLDSYQYSANLPLTATALLAVPLCPALISHFERLKSFNLALAREWVRGMARLLLLWFSLIALLILLIQENGFMDAGQVNYDSLGIWFFPVVLLSGITVLGNAILICNNRAVLAISLQIVIPIFAIYLTYFFGESQLGVFAPIAGLVFGQIINLMLLAYFCHKCGFPLFLGRSPAEWDKWGSTYIALVASAGLSSLSVPVALHFSASLGIGSTSIFYIGTKIFQAISVFISAIYLSLVLPYFTKLAIHKSEEYFRKILFLLAMYCGYVSALVSLVICMNAPLITKLLFFGSKVEGDQLDSLSRVIQVGVVQLPFFIVSITIVNYLIVLNRKSVIVFAGLFGLLVNLSLLWAFSSGGLSIQILSFAVTLGIVTSTLILIFWSKAKSIFGWKELGKILLMFSIFMAAIVVVIM